jgi:hypothetical protein
MAGQVNGVALGSVAVGGILVWSGIRNASITTSLRDLVTGKQPSPNTGANAISGNVSVPATTGTGASTGSIFGGTLPIGDLGASSGTAASNQAIGRLLAAPYGWSTGAQWNALVALWNRESGWSNTAENSTSGAYGIAQALGHGPTNQYPAGPANPPTSSASAQISWGLSYIKSTYGSPVNAWAHENSAGWY